MFKDWAINVAGCLYEKEGKQVATLSCIPAIFLNILNALLMFAGLIALLMFIIGGFKIMNTAGDAKKIEEAKNVFTFAIIGLMIVLLSFVAIRVISIVTGVECITQFGFGCAS
ncbi:hypothetical protein KKF11_00890 [Patescibacteria group bacterium]|nr:hypothetical protein [Patescibacteria group bacterium]